MTKLNKKLNGIVMTALSAVAVACLFVPMWGYPDYGSEFTYSVATTLKSYIDAMGFGSIFTYTEPPVLQMTIMSILAVITLVLAILTVVLNGKIFGHIAAGLSLVNVILLFMVKRGFVPTIYGTWVLLAAFALTAIWWFVTEVAPAQCKEFCRKFMVMIKRKPQRIPLCAFIVAFVYYSFNLTHVSNTTAKVLGSGMGLAGFVTMLLSMLGILCCMNAFPYRKKTNIPMLVLCFVMSGIIIGADVFYFNAVKNFIDTATDAAKVLQDTPSISVIYERIQTHMVLVGVSVVLTALLPVYAKLLRKVKTSVEVEGNSGMGVIDISGE